MAGPGRADLLVGYGDLLRRARRPGEAEAQYRKAISLSPGDFRAHFSYAQMLEEQRRLGEAEDEYVRAVSGDAGRMPSR